MKRRDMAMVFLRGGSIAWVPPKALGRHPESDYKAYFCLMPNGDRFYFPRGGASGHISQADAARRNALASELVEAAWDADVELAPEDA